MEKNIILSPMELEYFATGRHKLEGVTAQIITYAGEKTHHFSGGMIA